MDISPLNQMTRELQNERGRVISNFAFIEALMTDVIAAYYVPSTIEREKFRDQVLDHKYFSFDFKKTLLQTIITEKDSKKDKALFTKIEKLQQVRNVIAHGLFTLGAERGVAQREDIQFKHAGKTYVAHKILEEYFELSIFVTDKVKKHFGINAQIVA